VATAPLAKDGHLNCSPKGGDTFRVVSPNEVAYVDLTGSGIETAAHVQENGRIVIMFCSFAGPPKILRLHGRGKVVYPNDPQFAQLHPLFADHPGTRAIILVTLTRISDSCGYAVPLLDFVSKRDTLDRWTEKKGPEELRAYRAAKNRTSIDGIPGYLHS
jgi:hypothetical protein